MRKFLYLLIFFLTLHSAISLKAQDPLRFAGQISELMELSPATKGRHIIFTGSSSIRMWKSLNDDFPGFEVVNKGFGGSQMSDLDHYLEDLVLNSEPCQVFIYEGDNDLNAGKSVEEIIKDTRNIVTRIHNNNPEIEVVLISPKPSVARWHLRRNYEALNKSLKQLANEHAALSFVDVWSPALDEDGIVLKDIFLEDNLHMNAKGYGIWKESIEPFLASCAKHR